jgi:glycosyltransferase involved in cell wall biosynthesis
MTCRPAERIWLPSLRNELARPRVIRVLLIGPLPPPMGGDTRHFATLAEDLRASGRFSVELVNTSRGARHSSLVHNVATAFRTVVAVISRWRCVDVVSFHASDRGMFLFGPLIVALGKLLRMPIVLRVFGGSFGDFYQAGNALKRAITRNLLRCADVVLLQTQRAIRQLPPTGRLVWFSTYIKGATRPPLADERSSCTRFVFLGHLWRTKGIETILESAAMLPADCSIDLYGPLDEYTAETLERRGLGRVHYRGFLTHAQVDEALWRYDCLVLPTHHSGEGYPGVIAEAFAHGLPVITTNWLAIPEIVDETCGILIAPHDTAAFIAALTALNQDRGRWLQLKEGARRRAGQFDHTLWSRKFEDICAGLVVR